MELLNALRALYALFMSDVITFMLLIGIFVVALNIICFDDEGEYKFRRQSNDFRFPGRITISTWGCVAGLTVATYVAGGGIPLTTVVGVVALIIALACTFIAWLIYVGLETVENMIR